MVNNGRANTTTTNSNPTGRPPVSRLPGTQNHQLPNTSDSRKNVADHVVRNRINSLPQNSGALQNTVQDILDIAQGQRIRDTGQNIVRPIVQKRVSQNTPDSSQNKIDHVVRNGVNSFENAIFLQNLRDIEMKSITNESKNITKRKQILQNMSTGRPNVQTRVGQNKVVQNHRALSNTLEKIKPQGDAGPVVRVKINSNSSKEALIAEIAKNMLAIQPDVQTRRVPSNMVDLTQTPDADPVAINRTNAIPGLTPINTRNEPHLYATNLDHLVRNSPGSTFTPSQGGIRRVQPYVRFPQGTSHGTTSQPVRKILQPTVQPKNASKNSYQNPVKNVPDTTNGTLSQLVKTHNMMLTKNGTQCNSSKNSTNKTTLKMLPHSAFSSLNRARPAAEQSSGIDLNLQDINGNNQSRFVQTALRPAERLPGRV